VRLVHCGHTTWSHEKQKRAVARVALPVSVPVQVVRSEVIANGLLQTHSRHADDATAALPTRHVRGAVIPTGPAPTRTRGHPSDDTRRSIHTLGQAAALDAPLLRLADRLLRRLPRLAKRRYQGQALTRSLTGIYAFVASCLHSCMRRASLMSLHTEATIGGCTSSCIYSPWRRAH
jgi:hypothetical protein